MSKEQAPNSEINAYFAMLSSRLENVPELRPAIEFGADNPEYVLSTYGNYIGLINRMADLTDEERATIKAAKAAMVQSNGNFGTASQVSPDDILQELASEPELLKSLADQSANPASPYFAPAEDELVRRLEGGHRLKAAGKQPSDGDEESRKVIWGHTFITDPKALIYFMTCHHLERFMAVGLADHGSELARQKDFLLNALVDVVLLDQMTDKKFETIYEIWKAPKDQGGLGWVTQDRINSYESQRAS